VRTAIENEVHRTLTDAAFGVIAAGVAESARRRLLEAPFGPRPVIGVDPGTRGCRLAAVSAAGELDGSLALELASDEQRAAAGALVAGFARERSAAALAIGDGAGGRDFELVARAGLRAAALELPVALVSEAGASGWAASEAARAELPDAEPALRAAVSIARRFQDPLAELVRLDPKAIGGGQHHHEVPHALLHRALDAVIEDVVASVGVDVNSAPRALLGRVPGVSPAAAAAIVEHRAAHGRFATRRELLLAKLVDEPAFEHAAGFLRVREGENALDATAVHPERYAVLEAFAARHGKTAAELVGAGAALVRDAPELDLELGPLARADVARALAEAGRDPRPAWSAFAFRDDVRSIAELKPGMVCPGLVTNVTSFGVFVDVGVRQDGLVHVSQLPASRPGADAAVLQAGDRVEVRVLKVDLEKKQVSLTMKPRPEPRARPARKPRAPAAARPAHDRPPARDARGRRERPATPSAAPPDQAPREQPKRRPPPRPATTGKPGSGPVAKKPEPRRPAFNNPFAVLAGLKKR
jgi:uncharacterized protein